jgi:hypothetical protein
LPGNCLFFFQWNHKKKMNFQDFILWWFSLSM